jgi:hypothetical protein
VLVNAASSIGKSLLAAVQSFLSRSLRNCCSSVFKSSPLIWDCYQLYMFQISASILRGANSVLSTLNRFIELSLAYDSNEPQTKHARLAWMSHKQKALRRIMCLGEKCSATRASSANLGSEAESSSHVEVEQESVPKFQQKACRVWHNFESPLHSLSMVSHFSS